MKILIVSNTPWDDSNSFGSSFSNIFGGNENYEIANIYCQKGKPNTQICSRFFQINESLIVKSIKDKACSSGREVQNEKRADMLSSSQEKYLNKAKVLRWQVFFWARDLVWATKKWKSEALDRFIDDFNPDLIFQPIYYSSYIDEIGLYAKRRTDKPMVGYISDDCYTLKQFSLSPLFWIDRLIKRRFVKRAIDECQILYTITETQRKEYDGIFGEKCKVLFKGGNFDVILSPKLLNNPLKLVYTGNLGLGRWKSLAMISKALKTINQNGVKAQLYIYSQTPMTAKMKSQLDVRDSSFFMGSVSASKVKKIQRDADILVHVESFELSERYKARLSFSTKIVDYLEAGKCILAIGWERTGAIEYLKERDAALVVTNAQEVNQVLDRIVSTPSIIHEYAKKGYQCGKDNHQLESIREGLYEDLCSVVNNNCI